jgi:hypothetical protein
VVATQWQFVALRRDNVILALLAGDALLNQVFALVCFRRSAPNRDFLHAGLIADRWLDV